MLEPETTLQTSVAPNARGQMVVGVVSDTHGTLSPEAFRTLADLDPQLVVHAGDIGSPEVLARLEMLAPVVAVLGNNDYPGEFGPHVRSRAEFDLLGVSFSVTHIPSHLGALACRVAICGHTHVPKVEQCGACTVVNPGSVTRPRSAAGPTVARIVVEPGYVRQIQILHIDPIPTAGQAG
jgi:putative phosphoesterase